MGGRPPPGVSTPPLEYCRGLWLTIHSAKPIASAHFRLILWPLRSRHDELHQFGGARDRLVRRIRQFEQHFVRTRGQSDEDHRFAAGIDSGPGLVIHFIVQGANAWRDSEGSVTKHRQNAQVFGPVLNEYASQGQLFGSWWIDD